MKWSRIKLKVAVGQLLECKLLFHFIEKENCLQDGFRGELILREKKTENGKNKILRFVRLLNSCIKINELMTYTEVQAENLPLHKLSVIVKGRTRTQCYIFLAFLAWHRLIRLTYQVDSCLYLIFFKCITPTLHG